MHIGGRQQESCAIHCRVLIETHHWHKLLMLQKPKYRFWLQKGVKKWRWKWFQNLPHKLIRSTFLFLLLSYLQSKSNSSQDGGISKTVFETFWKYVFSTGLSSGYKMWYDFLKIALSLSVLVLWSFNAVSNLLTRYFWTNFPYGLTSLNQPVLL